MKRLIAAFAMILMLLCLLVGCKKAPAAPPAPVDPAAPLYGTWVVQVDLAEYLKARIVSANEELKNTFELSEFKATFTLAFKTDGSFQRTIDGGFPEESLETLRADLKKGYAAYYTEYLKELELDMTLAEFEKSTGVSLDRKVEQVADPTYLAGLVAELNYTGAFAVEDGLLYMDSFAELPKRKISHQFAVKDGALTLSECSAPSGFETAFYPLTLKASK